MFTFWRKADIAFSKADIAQYSLGIFTEIRRLSVTKKNPAL